ncbi:hypothetical protein FIU61_08670 [Enterococcus faecium]|nr:hypothetical protein FIU61_08670 [Enterococcus faecium]
MYENCFSNFCGISAYFRRSYFWNTVYSEKGTVTRLLSQSLWKSVLIKCSSHFCSYSSHLIRVLLVIAQG